MNKTNRNQPILRMLALLLAMLMLASCSQSAATDEPVETELQAETTTPETEAPKPTDGLEDVNMDGFEMNMLAGLTAWTKAEYIAEEDGEPVNDAIFKRNRYLEERFNCTISALQDESLGHGDVANKASTDVKSGDGQYDFVSVYDIYVTRLINELSDWNHLTQIRKDEAWWNPDATEVYNWGGKQLALNGYTSLSAVSSSTCILFNKDMLEKVNVDQVELYKHVNDGTWTLDRMYEYGKMAVQDLNGDSVLDDKDQWGIHDATSTKTYVNAAVASADIRYIEYDEEHNPIYAFDKESCISMFQTFIDKTMNSGIYNGNAETADQSTTPAYFPLNQSLFGHVTMKQVENYRSIDAFEIGILPFPKFDDTIENYRSISVGSAAIMLLRTVKPERYENLGTILEAMAFYTYHEVLPIYKEIALKTKSARDNESADMLDIIFNTICFDMAHNLESIVTKPLITATFCKKDSGKVASTIEKNKKSIQKNLEKLVMQASEIE